MADSLFGRNSLPVWASASTIVSPGLPGDGYPTRVAPDANAQLYGHVPGRSFHGRRENHVNYEILESLRTLRRTRVRHAAMHWTEAMLGTGVETEDPAPFQTYVLTTTYNAKDGKWYATQGGLTSSELYISCDGMFWQPVSTYYSYFEANDLHPIIVTAHPTTGGPVVLVESDDGADHYFFSFEWLPGKLRLTQSTATITDVSSLFAYPSTGWPVTDSMVTANLTTGNRMVVCNGDALLSFASPASAPTVYITADYKGLAVTRGLTNDVVVATGLTGSDARFIVSTDGGVTWSSPTTFVTSAISRPRAAYDSVLDKWWLHHGTSLARYSCSSTPGVPNSVADYVVPAAAVAGGGSSYFDDLGGQPLVAHDDIVIVRSPPVLKVIDASSGGSSAKAWAVCSLPTQGGKVTMGGTDTINGYTCPRIVLTGGTFGEPNSVRVSGLF